MSFTEVTRPHPQVAVVTLNRPERMNAMAFDVMIPFREALEAASADNDTRVVVLTGAGGAFCSGADLEDAGIIPNIAGLTRTTIAQRSMELLDDVIRAVRKMHQPVIGAINGPAIGGGFCLGVVGPRVAKEPTRRLGALVLYRAFRHGSPRLWRVGTFLGLWLMPQGASGEARRTLK